MELKKLDYKLTVCKVADISDIDTTADFYFIAKTDEELSLVCRTEDVPDSTLEREDGWKGFRIQGYLIFHLSGYFQNFRAYLLKKELASLLYPHITLIIF